MSGENLVVEAEGFEERRLAVIILAVYVDAQQRQLIQASHQDPPTHHVLHFVVHVSNQVVITPTFEKNNHGVVQSSLASGCCRSYVKY